MAVMGGNKSRETEQLQVIAENARDITGVPFTLLSLLNEKTNMLEFKVIGGINTPLMQTALKAAEKMKPDYKPLEYSHPFDINPYVKKIVETKRYQITNLYSTVENMMPKPLAVAGNTILRIKNVAAFPVLIQEKVMGIMVYMSQKDVEEHDIRIMQAFVDQVSLLVENIQLAKEARNKSTELEEAKAGLEGRVKERIKELEEARNNLELKVKERTKSLEEAKKKMEEKLEELEKFQKLTMGREKRIIELKDKIWELEKKLKEEKK